MGKKLLIGLPSCAYIILNSRVYFVTTLNPPAVMGWYLRQSINPFAG